MARRYRPSSKRGLKVTVYDPQAHQSISFTVYGASLKDAAREAHQGLGGRWRTTSLGDRRHKKRRF